MTDIKKQNRKLVSNLKRRMAEKSPLIQVVIGPRQVGKTTALRAILAEGGIYHSADYPTPLGSEVLVQWWEEAERDKSRFLAVDEVQKISDWSETIKYLWDRSANMRVILTGSSSLLVERGLKETLAGRFELVRVEHWNYAEAAQVFDISLRQFIEFGCYPGSMKFLDDRRRWGDFVRDAIVEPAIGRDLLQLHPLENPALMRQIFGAAVSLPAQLISMQKLQGALQTKGAVPTISRYLSLLAEAFLVTGVQKYHASQLRMRQSIPKLIVHDNALCRAFERPIENEINQERFGRYFENAIGARFIEAGWDTYYWKHRDDEVDFIVIGPENQKWAVEVKVGKTNQTELRGLFAFCKAHPEFEPKIVSLLDPQIAGVERLDPQEILSLYRS